MKVELSYNGGFADHHELDFYDVGQAMVGFQRSIALTTHLVLNGNIITQAPALRGARVIARAPEAGSYKIPAYITSIGLAVYGLGTADTDTPLGHLVYSAYDYAVSRTLGFNVDFDKSLGQKFEEAQDSTGGKLPQISLEKFDSLSEKIEPALKDIHRPIINSRTATYGSVSGINGKAPFEIPIGTDTYSYLISSDQDTIESAYPAKVSSYNINTFKGRAYLPDERRPIPFVLNEVARSPAAIARITASLRANAKSRLSDEAEVELIGYANRSPTGRLKSISVVGVE